MTSHIYKHIYLKKKKKKDCKIWKSNFVTIIKNTKKREKSTQSHEDEEDKMMKGKWNLLSQICWNHLMKDYKN